MSSSAITTLTINELSTVHEELISIASKWKYFGGKIGVSPAELSNIEKSNTDFDERLYKVLEYRLKQLPLLTWHDIVRGLRSPAVHEDALASEIECKYTHSQLQPVRAADMPTVNVEHSQYVEEFAVPSAKRPCLQQNPSLFTSSYAIPSTSSSLQKFIEYVKILYRCSPIEKRTEVLKLPTPGKVYINLACIDRKTEGLRTEYDEITEAMVRDGNVDVIQGRKCPIDMNKIVADLPTEALEKVIIVEGAPGVGKSTFAWEFCRRWERGEIAQQYNLVLLLRLRDESISKAKCLKDLICHPSQNVCEDVVSELESSLGVNVLIIMEGYDELPGECRSHPSLFLELINGQVLPLATIMITSRPWATCGVLWNFKHRLFKHIEVMGFTKKQITSYINENLSPAESEEIVDYTKKHPQIEMCMYIPLNCAIVVTVYKENKLNGVPLPNTLTELYSSLANAILLRYLRFRDSSAEVLTDFDKLPSEVQLEFRTLCELAYNSITTAGDQMKLIFTDLPADFDGLGFMDSVFEIYTTRSSVASHNFIHLTFQEFLAAVHISRMEKDQRMQHFKRHEEGRLRVVLRFLAGLTNLEDFLGSSDFIKILGKVNHPEKTFIDYTVSSQVSWVYEARRKDLVRETFDESLTVDYTCKDHFDSTELGYCMAHSCCQWVWTVGREIGEDDVKNVVDELTNDNECTGGLIIGLRGQEEKHSGINEGLRVTPEGLNMIFKELNTELHELAIVLPAKCTCIAWPELCCLSHLTLQISFEDNWELACLLRNHRLVSLAIVTDSSSVLSLADCEAVVNFIANTSSLKELCFPFLRYNFNLPSDGLYKITAALVENESLQLLTLDLSGLEEVFHDDVESIASSIGKCTTLSFFYVPTLSAYEVLTVVKAVSKLPNLHDPELTFAVCGDDDVPYFADLISEYSDLCTPSGDIFDIGDEGVEYLVESLQQDSTMHQLDLQRNDISDVGAEHLAKILCANSSLTILILSNNTIGDEGAEYLASALYFNDTLKVLYLEKNKIGSDGAKALAKALHFNSTLENLNLRQNPEIGEEGILYLLQALTVNDSIGDIQKDVRSGLWLDKAAYKNAIKYPEYSRVKHRVSFSSEVSFVPILHEQGKSKVSNPEPEESVIYIGKACSYISQSGISLHFPAAKCPTPIKVSVKVVNGEYTLPPEYEGMPLVSSMFKITASDTLPAPITVQMEHCAVVDREDSLIHMIAEDVQPYYFKELPGGNFSVGQSYGEIKLEKFSIFTTICKVLGLYLDLSLSLFYHKDDTATFVATRNLREVIAAVKERFTDAVETFEQSMIYYCYTTPAITLTIPEERPGGWSVVPKCRPPQIEKELICSFEKGMTPPSIQLKMEWRGQGPPKEKDIDIQLNGCSVESLTLSCKPSHKRMAQSQRQQSCSNSQLNHSSQWIKHCREFRALQKSNDIFTRSLDPENLAPVLYSRGLLTLQERERATQQTSTSSQKLEEIFKGLMRRVRVNPQCFHTLLQTLSEEQANEHVAKRIKEIYDDECRRQSSD